MKRLALGCAALLFLGACDSDDGDGETTLGATTAGSSTTDNATTSEGATTTGDPTGAESSTSGAEGSSSSGGVAEGSSSGGSESTGNPNACDPPVVGEYNACLDENGNPMPVMCNYMGTGKSVGQVGCLTGPTEGANACMIQNCVDDCDCFNAPPTGNAPSVCREVLAGGGMACILACDGGETCPDGMTCDNGICWHGL